MRHFRCWPVNRLTLLQTCLAGQVHWTVNPDPKGKNMRKITSDMLAAIADKRAWRDKATSTHIGERGILVRLHGNLIAIVTPETVEITAAGWATAPTCDRLSAIAYEFAGATVGRKKEKIIVRQNGNQSIHDADEWITIYRA
jgi:hypothetical protein